MAWKLWNKGKKAREEEILVLYGSQMGRSEKAAQAIHEQISKKLSGDGLVVTSRLVELDDFLEARQDNNWTRLVVLCVSSFGTGEAPMGAKQFRELMDNWIKVFKDQPDKRKPLTGLQFALCGLGDSCYETYQKNPNTVQEGLTLAGATLVGERGMADAVSGFAEQQKTIDEWTEGIWSSLADALKQGPLSAETLAKMKAETKPLSNE